MKFKTLALVEEWEQVHPQARAVATEFDLWCQEMGLGEAIVTNLLRKPAFYKENGLAPKKFSWHFVGCAIDFRIRHWTAAQQMRAQKWMASKKSNPWYEVVTENHGTGPHFHLAYRDFSLRRRWEAAQGGKNEGPAGSTPEAA